MTVNDICERLEISCARCGGRSKPVTDDCTSTLGGAGFIRVGAPVGWRWIDGRVVCDYCGHVLDQKLKEFWAKK